MPAGRPGTETPGNAYFILRNRLAIAMSDPSDLKALDCLHSALGKELEIRVADQSQLDTFIRQFYGDDDLLSNSR